MIFILLMLRTVILSQLETKHHLDPIRGFNKFGHRGLNQD